MRSADATARLAAAKHPDLSPEQFIAEIYARLKSDDSRPIPYYRVRELCPPLKQAYVYKLLESGELTAVKLEGITLVDADSVKRWLSKATPYVKRGAQ